MIEISEIKQIGPFEEWSVMELRRLRNKIKELKSGSGGIMEMKQTISDKEQEIERLHVALREIAMLNNQRDRFSSQIDSIISQILNEKKDENLR
jgi:hypothetical protein